MNVALVGPQGSGKTTLFSALTGGRDADGVGMVDVPDDRLLQLADAVQPKRIVAAQVRLIDAPAGSPAQRIAAAREADVVLKVVRGFGPEPDPAGDLEGIQLDMVLTDLATVERRLELLAREVRGGRKGGVAELATLELAKRHLDEGRGLDTLVLDEESRHHLDPLFAVTRKPSVVVVNVDDRLLPDGGESGQRARAVAETRGIRCLVIGAQLELELAALTPADADQMRQSYGLTQSSLGAVARAVWQVGGLITFFTAGEPEVRAWPCEDHAAAPAAAGVIHSDFERSFIRAEVTSVEELVAAGSMEALRSQGKLRVEGKEYRVVDGDVVFFRVGR